MGIMHREQALPDGENPPQDVASDAGGRESGEGAIPGRRVDLDE